MILENLKILREEHNLKQEDIANILNVTRQTYSYWENGDRNIDIESLIKLSDYYKVTLDFLVGRTEVRTNIAASTKDLQHYINHCVAGYYRYVNKAKD